MVIDVPDLNDIEFETSCPNCWGSGRLRTKAVTKNTPTIDIKCGHCDGSGKVITPLGHALIQFLQKHGYKKVDGN